MNILRRISLIVISVCVLLSPAAAQEAGSGIFTLQTDPVALIGAYYNAIHTKDYTRAYYYWQTPPQGRTLAQFANGFVDTASAAVIVRLPVLQDAGAGNVYAQVPALVVATHTNGSVHYYVGCFTTHKTNVPVGDATTPDPNWTIQQGKLTEQTVPDVSALNTACATSGSLATAGFMPVQDDPLTLLQTYFTALVTGDALVASSSWSAADVYAPTFLPAIAASTETELLVNPIYYTEGAAGSIYTTVASLLTLTNGLTVTYMNTCFGARLVNVPLGDAAVLDPNWHLINALTQPTTNVYTAVTALANGCISAG